MSILKVDFACHPHSTPLPQSYVPLKATVRVSSFDQLCPFRRRVAELVAQLLECPDTASRPTDAVI